MFLQLLYKAKVVTPEAASAEDPSTFRANGTTDRVCQLTLEGPEGVEITVKALVEVTNYIRAGWFVESAEKTLVKPIGQTIVTDKWAAASGPFAFIRARITEITEGGLATVTLAGV